MPARESRHNCFRSNEKYCDITQLCSLAHPPFRKERREVRFGRGVMFGMIVDVLCRIYSHS